MSWIERISYEAATGKLRKLYDRVKGRNQYIDNILLVHSLRPHSLEGHMVLYKNVLHHASNTLPKWLLESIGVFVSLLNQCDYCVAHHMVGLRNLIRDDARADAILNALSQNLPAEAFKASQAIIFSYVETLTRHPESITSQQIEALRQSGYTDGEILEINQVTAYFAYANRTVLGLGVNTEGDILGLAPSHNDDPDNWHHQ